MTLKKLPDHIQHSINAYSINSISHAVEELVYNSIDAGATSIAVRVNIKDYFVQVIDNGAGLNVKDLRSMGKMYMTSKFEQNSPETLPKYYGFRGQSIASMVKVSQELKITTKCDGDADTWTKLFTDGKESDIKKVETRPSKGTTVELKGYLYNAAIRRKNLHELNELNNVKSFLEKVALINNNISFTLRDNSSNEILLTINKNRDILQSLCFLKGININKLKELQVEKNLYKVKAFITFDDSNEVESQYNWIYLNRYFLKNRRIRNVVDNLMRKYLRCHSNDDKAEKVRSYQKETPKLVNNAAIPSYFIFITCPFDEYDCSRSPKQSFLEFKNWDNINNILEKVVKFYFGDFKIKNNQCPQINNEEKPNTEDTRDQLKKIIDRVLGNALKKENISQMQKGVKGKYIKRKKEKKKSCIKDVKSYLQGHQISKGLRLEKPKPVIDLSKIIVPQPRNTELDNPKPNVVGKTNEINPLTVNVKKQHSILNNSNQMLSRERFVLQNSGSDFRKECAALKRKCDELELKVDRILVRQTKKKSKKRTDIIDKYVDSRTDYSNMTRNDSKMMQRTTQSVIIQNYNVTDTSPYFPPHKLHSSEHSQTPVCGVNTAYGCQLPRNFLTPEINNRAFLPFNKSSFNSHQLLTLQTFQSHGYDLQLDKHNNKIRKFISKHSIDNFNQKVKNTNVFKVKRNRHRGHFYNFLWNQKLQNNVNIDLRTTTSSYTIEFSRSEYDHYSKDICSSKKHNIIKNDRQFGDTDKGHNVGSKDIDFTTANAMADFDTLISDRFYFDTNSIFSSNYHEIDYDNVGRNCCSGNYFDFQLSPTHSKYCNQSIKATYTIETYEDNAEWNHGLTKNILPSSPSQIFRNDFVSPHPKNSNLDVVFVSEPQENNVTPSQVIPAELCEISLSDCESLALEENNSKTVCNASSDNLNDMYHSKLSSELENEIVRNFSTLRILNSFDHDSLLQFNLSEQLENNVQEIKGMLYQGKQIIQSNHTNSPYFENNFELRDRQRFLPKGMSPLNNCKAHMQKISESHTDKEYFEASVYNNFLDDLNIHSNIYEPDIQNMKGVGTNEIQKFEHRVNKDNGSLVFDGKTLETANVLGQVDNKFIAAELKGRNIHTKLRSRFLVLFDQHAVHERIKLEKNLFDYIKDENWKSAEIDNITIKLAKEEILYLHNFKDKFTRFGLKWYLLNNEEIVVNGIPEAILGKNSRQEDKIMIALKNIIIEIIKSLQNQRGCVQIYLKTIMDLVFSEACRYAIKFGDKLTIDKCKELLRDLSHCKTPFQCAHGRPVMAVLLELKDNPSKEYSINYTKLLDFHKNLKKIF